MKLKIFLISIILASCSGGGSDGQPNTSPASQTQPGSNNPTPSTNAEGLWAGTIVVDGVSTFQMTAYLFNSELHAFSIEGGEVYQGTFTTGQETIDANLRTFDLNGNMIGTATLSGTVTESGTIEATFSATTGTSGNVSLAFEMTSNNTPNLDDIDGIFTDNRVQISATVDNQGNFTAQDSLGCDVAGDISVNNGINLFSIEAIAATNCAERAGNYSGVLTTAEFVSGNEGFIVVASNSDFVLFYVFEEQ